MRAQKSSCLYVMPTTWQTSVALKSPREPSQVPLACPASTAKTTNSHISVKSYKRNYAGTTEDRLSLPTLGQWASCARSPFR
jgi:hypothetical protein